MRFLLLPLLLLAAAVNAQDPTAEPAARSATVDGTFTSWFANGRVLERGPVDAQGRRQGAWIVRHANGRTAAFGSYRDAERHEGWTTCDPYGRPVQHLCYDRGVLKQSTPPSREMQAPLSLDDLRVTLVGERTLGELLAAHRPAPDAAAQTALAAELAAVGPTAAAVVFDEAGGAGSAAARAAWLGLLARLELPDDQPAEPLQRWQWEPECADAARAVLQRWSAKFEREWQPLIAAGNADPNRAGALQRLGAKAYGALPALRRQLAGRDASLYWVLPEVLGVPPGSGARLLADLSGPDRELRLQALALILQLLPEVAIPAADLVRLSRDEDAAIAFWAAKVLAADHREQPQRYDAHLDELIGHRLVLLRSCAARRLVQLGRTRQALPLLRALVRAAPDVDGWYEAAAALARLSDDRAADRQLMLAAAQAAERFDLREPLADLADDDSRVADFLVAAWLGDRPFSVDLTRLPGPQWPHVRALLQAVLDRDDPSQRRVAAFRGLWALCDGAAERQQLVQRGLDDRDATVRARALAWLAWDRRVAGPACDRLLALVRDPATQPEALRLLSTRALPAGFDPRDLDAVAASVPPTVLATWADGDADRVAVLVDQVIEASSPWQQPAHAALLLLRADLQPFAEKLVEAALVPGSTNGSIGVLLHELLPAHGRRVRVRLALRAIAAPREGGFGRGHTFDAAFDKEDVPMICAALADPDPAIASAAVTLLGAMGMKAAGGADALVAAVPTLPVVALKQVPATLLAIAPARATAVCGDLLDHADESVRLAAALAPGYGGFLPGGPVTVPLDPDFARRLVAVVAASPPGWWTHGGGWFRLLADRGRSALPEMTAALRARPGHEGLAAALGEIGADAVSASTELLAALAAGNAQAAAALGAVLPGDAEVRDLLLQALVGPSPHLRDGATRGLAVMSRDAASGNDAAIAKALGPLCATGSDAEAESAAMVLAQRGQRDAKTIAALLAFLRRPYPSKTYLIRAVLRDDVMLALLPEFTAFERERELVQYLTQHPTASRHPGLIAALAGLIDEARDRPAVLMALAMVAPEHPLVVAMARVGQRSWNRGCSPWLAQAGTAVDLQVQRLLAQQLRQDQREGVVAALRTKGKAAVDAIRIHLGALDAGRRTAALHLLRELGEVAEPAFADAARCLRDRDPSVRQAAARAVIALTPDAATAARALLEAGEGEPHRRFWGVLDQAPPELARLVLDGAPIDLDAEPYMLPTVLRLRGADDDLLARLRQLLREPGLHDRKQLVEAAAACGARAGELLPELKACLQWPVADWCVPVIDLLGQLGAAAGPATADLEELLPVPELRFAARRALASIRAGSK